MFDMVERKTKIMSQKHKKWITNSSDNFNIDGNSWVHEHHTNMKVQEHPVLINELVSVFLIIPITQRLPGDMNMVIPSNYANIIDRWPHIFHKSCYLVSSNTFKLFCFDIIDWYYWQQCIISCKYTLVIALSS